MDSETAAAAADAARDALQALAHATRRFEEPGDSYAVLGSLDDGLASLRQTLDQLAGWHERHAPTATDARSVAGQVAAEIAAAELQAAALLERSCGRVSAAWSHNGRVVWPADASTGRSRQLAAPSSFGGPGGPSTGGGIAR